LSYHRLVISGLSVLVAIIFYAKFAVVPNLTYCRDPRKSLQDFKRLCLLSYFTYGKSKTLE
jgi:hypothetical protein